MPPRSILGVLEVLLKPLKVITLNELSHYLDLGERLVNDPKDSVYAAAALYLRYRGGYEGVIVLSRNKRDYKARGLALHSIRVVTPEELYRAYLGAGASAAPEGRR